jgi:cellobiose transport system permease protein
VLSTVPQLAGALVLAHVLNHVRLRFAVFFRMSMLVPYITSVAATTIVFAQMFDRDYGLLNWLLGLVGVGPVDFDQSVWGSHLMIATMVMWRWSGFTTLLYLASLQAVPRESYEAALHRAAAHIDQRRADLWRDPAMPDAHPVPLRVAFHYSCCSSSSAAEWSPASWRAPSRADGRSRR